MKRTTSLSIALLFFFFAGSAAAAVDPTIIFSTYFNGGASSVAYDSAGNIYVLSNTTTSPGTPIASPALSPACTPSTCSGISVTKLNPTGTAAIYSTYFGGTASEIARAIA